ncbi:uncharacterized protein DS421_6g172750 [Arachis hypogaea]|nr:uncharacterized protein DS421_6g172750 [Arachis hypogaea]
MNNNQAHVAENQHQNTDDNSGTQTLFFTSNSCDEDEIYGTWIMLAVIICLVERSYFLH